MKTIALGELVDSCPVNYGADPGSREVDALVAKVSNVADSGEFHRKFETRSFTDLELKKLTARPGDLFVVKSSGSKKRILSGKTAIVAEDSPAPLIASNFLLLLRPRAELVEPRYLWRVLNSSQSKAFVKTVVSAFTYPNLKWTTYRKHPIPFPPLAEQKRIAEILDAADALRVKRRESLAQLDTFLQSTFLDMFGDPVTNPMGWDKVELASLVQSGDRINYGVIQPGVSLASGKPLIRVGDFVSGELDTANLKLIDPAIETKYKRSRLNGRELLISCVGSIGTVCRVPSAAAGFNIARAVARVPLEEGTDRDFMLHCLRSEALQRHFSKETRTVSQPTLNIGLIKDTPVIQPPAEVQQRFAAIVESVEKRQTQQREHLAELDTLFASLQSRAFRGDL